MAPIQLIEMFARGILWYSPMSGPFSASRLRSPAGTPASASPWIQRAAREIPRSVSQLAPRWFPRPRCQRANFPPQLYQFRCSWGRGGGTWRVSRGAVSQVLGRHRWPAKASRHYLRGLLFPANIKFTNQISKNPEHTFINPTEEYGNQSGY